MTRRTKEARLRRRRGVEDRAEPTDGSTDRDLLGRRAPQVPERTVEVHEPTNPETASDGFVPL